MVGLVSASGFTVIVVKDGECQVLEGFDSSMDDYIPDGWSVIQLSEEQCWSVVEELKHHEEYDQNFRDYLGLVNCSKPSGLKSVSYLPVGADVVCEEAGYSFNQDRFIVREDSNQLTVEEHSEFPYVSLLLLLAIIVFLLLIIRKKKMTRHHGF